MTDSFGWWLRQRKQLLWSYLLQADIHCQYGSQMTASIHLQRTVIKPSISYRWIPSTDVYWKFYSWRVSTKAFVTLTSDIENFEVVSVYWRCRINEESNIVINGMAITGRYILQEWYNKPDTQREVNNHKLSSLLKRWVNLYGVKQ